MPSSILKALWIGLVLCIHLSWAHRVRPQTQQQQPHHKISLLIVRHGLSCANLIQKQSNYWDLGGRYIPDPALTGIGQFDSTVAGHAISKWMKEPRQVEDKIVKVDATLTSALGRAIETSLLTFAGDQLQAEVVPFVQPKGSDEPLSHSEQLQKLRKSLSRRNMTNFYVDYHWADGAHAKKNTWDEFIAFLANIYLPVTLKRLGKEIGNRTVLAVTTHNKWIDEFLKKKCGLSEKLRSNGVLHLEYNFIQQASPRTDMVAPFKLEEVKGRQCETIHEGSRAMDTDDSDIFGKLCVADIGELCIGSAGNHAFFGSRVTETLEAQIVDLSNQMMQTESNIHRTQEELTQIQDMVGTSQSQKLMSKAKILRTSLNTEFEKLEGDLTRLQALKQERCWTGGLPNAQGYSEQWANKSSLHEGASHWWLDAEPSVPKRLTFEMLDLLDGGTVYSPCLLVYNKQHNLWWKTVKFTESTCNEGLSCYANDGKMPAIGTRGICAIPRKKPCDLSDSMTTYKRWSHGCRPHTECQSNLFFGASCQDVEPSVAMAMASANSRHSDQFDHDDEHVFHRGQSDVHTEAFPYPRVRNL